MAVKVVKKASAAAISVLRQATAIAPKRNKVSDGLLPSAAHIQQSPSSDHNTGLAVDLTHDPKHGIDCGVIFEELKKDKRVKYLIHNKVIWSRARAKEGNRPYDGSNPHIKHLHISIDSKSANNTSSWFPFLEKQPRTIVDTAKVAVQSITPAPKKKLALCTCTTCPVHNPERKAS